MKIQSFEFHQANNYAISHKVPPACERSSVGLVWIHDWHIHMIHMIGWVISNEYIFGPLLGAWASQKETRNSSAWKLHWYLPTCEDNLVKYFLFPKKGLYHPNIISSWSINMFKNIVDSRSGLASRFRLQVQNTSVVIWLEMRNRWCS